MSGNVEVISKELIKPSSPTPHESRDLKLSLLDQLVPSAFVSLIFFYQNESLCSKLDHSRRSNHLKQSLSEVLTKFYPLAGRINGNISVDCNDSGALFVVARVHSQLSQSSQIAAIDERLLNQYLPFNPRHVTGSDNSLLLAIQISFFECGGIAVGVCISHKIADTNSFVTFMNAWADTCRGKADGIVQPNFELANHLFPPTNIPLPTFDLPSAEEKETFVVKRFVFDKEKLAEIKQLVSSKVKDPTRVEAVSAYMWKHFIGVTQAKVDHKTNFLAHHAVNFRPRMSLPVDGFVFGNLSVFTPALLPMSGVEDDKEYDADLVWHLRSAIREVNDDFIKNVQSGLPYLNTLKNARERLAKQPTTSCYFSSWCRFPAYEVDYGWGKPLWVRTVAFPVKNGIILMSTSCGDGIEAWTNMVEDEMAMLPDELLSLATSDITGI